MDIKILLKYISDHILFSLFQLQSYKAGADNPLRHLAKLCVVREFPFCPRVWRVGVMFYSLKSE
jgi:hypothetical protein